MRKKAENVKDEELLCDHKRGSSIKVNGECQNRPRGKYKLSTNRYSFYSITM